MMPSFAPFHLAKKSNRFVVTDKHGKKFYTPVGAFAIKQRVLVKHCLFGCAVVGFFADFDGNVVGIQGKFVIPRNDLAPRKTLNVRVVLNLRANIVPPKSRFLAGATPAMQPASNTFNTSISAQLFDTLGHSHMLTLYFIKVPVIKAYGVFVSVNGCDVTPDGQAYRLTFDVHGNIIPSSKELKVTFFPGTGAASPQMLNIDLNSCTGLPRAFEFIKIVQDGYGTARLINVEVNPVGEIVARYGNGQSKTFGHIASEIKCCRRLTQLDWGDVVSSYGESLKWSVACKNIFLSRMLLEFYAQNNLAVSPDLHGKQIIKNIQSDMLQQFQTTAKIIARYFYEVFDAPTQVSQIIFGYANTLKTTNSIFKIIREQEAAMHDEVCKKILDFAEQDTRADNLACLMFGG